MSTKVADESLAKMHLEEHETRNEAGTPSRAEMDKILRKIDVRVIPVLAVLYLLSFLDRGSIGNANIQGLSKDLNLIGHEYNWVLTIFFFPYCFFEPVCNMLLVKFKPSRWLPLIVLIWGVITTLTGIVQGYSGLLAARFFLGLAEAGLFPGIAFYMSLWYPRANAQLRLSLVFASASMAGAFSGLLAYLISKMHGVGGLEGWRWIFILEGILTVVIAVFAYKLIDDEPASAKFLSDHEKYLLFDAFSENRNSTVPIIEDEKHLKWKHVVAAVTDWQTFFHCISYWGMACAVYALSLFLPAIINGLGYRAEIAQLLTIPVYAAATMSCITVGYLADRTKKRSAFAFASYLAIFVGYLLAVAPPNFIPGLTYAGCFIAACGIYAGIPGLLALSSNNYAPNPKRAVGTAIQIGFGTMGGAAASNFYHKSDAPRYRLGHSLVLAFAALGSITVAVYYLLCRRINSKRDAAGEQQTTLSDEQLGELGDKAPDFRYKL